MKKPTKVLISRHKKPAFSLQHVLICSFGLVFCHCLAWKGKSWELKLHYKFAWEHTEGILKEISQCSSKGTTLQWRVLTTRQCWQNTVSHLHRWETRRRVAGHFNFKKNKRSSDHFILPLPPIYQYILFLWLYCKFLYFTMQIKDHCNDALFIATNILCYTTVQYTVSYHYNPITTLAIFLGYKNSNTNSLPTFLCNLMFSGVLDFGILQGANSESMSKRERGQHMEMTIYAFII